MLSIKVNGNMIGFFPCNKEVRQGDLLVFCLDEEVLSMGISHLVSSKKMFPMASPKGMFVFSHVLYVDDIFIFFMTE